MTECHIYGRIDNHYFSMPPIIHQRLKTSALCYTRYSASILDSLTLPCLEELYTTDLDPLVHLPALFHRSSCPCTRITFFKRFRCGAEILPHLLPLPGVTDLVLETLEQESYAANKLLLEECFPDLHTLTLGIEPFLFLWTREIIPRLLDRKSPSPFAGKLRKILVVERCRPGEINDRVWNSYIGEELRASQFNIVLREDGFEFLIPEA
jgi:hypothetical protein